MDLRRFGLFWRFIMKKNTGSLAEEKVGRLMVSYALPCVISLLVGALYNIVDQIFIANASYLGSCGNAANTVVFPLTVIALAVAVMVGDGCSAFVSLNLGKGEKKEAAHSVGLAVLMTVFGSLLLCGLYLAFSEPILKVFGGTVNEETFSFSKEYFLPLTLGLPFYMFGQAMNPVIRADGSPKFAMAATLTGAAEATVLGQMTTAFLSLYYLFRMKSVKLTKRDFLPDGRLVGAILSLGICSFLSQISLVFAMAAINNMIKKYGAADPIFGQEEFSQIPMAVVGIVMKVFQIVISVVVGMAAGCIPLVGYNRGAGRDDRVKKLFLLLLAGEAAVGFVALFAAECLPRQLIRVFGSAKESAYYTAFAVRAFRVYLSAVVFACLNKATFIFLQAMGKAFSSTFLSMLREIVFGVGFALLLPRFFGLDGVLYSMPVSDLLTALVSFSLILLTLKELSGKKESGALARG